MFNLSEDSSVKSSDHVSRIIPSILTDEGKIMLAAIISLLVVILLVLLLHVYGRWFFAESPRSRRRSVSVSHVMGPTRLYHLSTFTYEDTYSGRPANGLEASIIASLPLFVYCSEDYNGGLECVVCLSVFQDDEIGRSLPKCKHAFHVECIDMWLLSNSTCPICRAPVVSEKSVAVTSLPIEASPSQGRSQEPLIEIITGESEEGNGDSPLMELISMEMENSERPSSYKEASSSPSTLASPSPLTLGCSLQRMLNRNRSEGRMQSSSGTNESNV